VCSSDLSNPRFRYRHLLRILTLGGVLAVVVIGVVVATTVFKNEDHTVAAEGVNENDSTLPTITIPDDKEPPTVALDKRIPKIAARFIQTAVTRDNVAASWQLTGHCLKGLPCLRAGFTRKMWASGAIPVVPYPAYGGVKYKVTYSYRDDAMLEVALYPRKGSSLKAGIFHIGLHRYPGKDENPWKVVHWAPRSMTIVPSND